MISSRRATRSIPLRHFAVNLVFVRASSAILPRSSGKVGDMNRRSIRSLVPLLLFPSLASAQLAQQTADANDGGPTLSQVLDRAAELAPLKTVMVAQNGEILAERGYRGNSTTAPTNIKSASKIDRLGAGRHRHRQGHSRRRRPEDRADSADDLPPDPDPRLAKITIGNLLSMQAGLERTSGPNYGRWVSSRNWVRAALAQPFVDEPGGGMLYSTGSTHLLSAILTRTTGRSTLELARDWLGTARGLRDRRLGARPAGHLSRRQPDGDEPALAAGLRRALSQRRQDG